MLFNGIEIPHRMLKLRRLPSGMPIPRFATWDEGKPNLTVMDMDFANRAIPHRLCWICAERLGRNVAFVGGPKSELSGYFTEPPFHRDCAEFAMHVCPYILQGYHQRANPLEKDDERNLSCDPNNPGIFAMVISDSYHFIPSEACFSVKKKEVIWYKHGRLATDKEVEDSKRAAKKWVDEKLEKQAQELQAHREKSQQKDIIWRERRGTAGRARLSAAFGVLNMGAR